MVEVLQTENKTHAKKTTQMTNKIQIYKLNVAFTNVGLFRDNVHSHLRHAKRPMAVRGGGGLSNGRFPWTKWDFCSEVKKLYKSV